MQRFAGVALRRALPPRLAVTVECSATVRSRVSGHRRFSDQGLTALSPLQAQQYSTAFGALDGHDRRACASSSSAPDSEEEILGEEQWHKPPAAWAGKSDSTRHVYTDDDVTSWRSEFLFSMRQNSIVRIGYTDDELIEWRVSFDEVAHDNAISYSAFEHFVSKKYRGLIPDEKLARKVQIFWSKFDTDNNGSIDFGEFMSAGLLFDVDYCKESIRNDGIEETFMRYAEEGYMSEAHFFQLMVDFNFFVATATDVQKLIRAADKDDDGLVCLSDFVQWAEGVFDDTAYQYRRKRRKGGSL